MNDARPLPVLRTALRVLFFRASRDELASLDGRHLAFGLLCTWIVGMGRYWDAPQAHLWQRLGVGSLVYVVVLAVLLFLIVLPLRPERWSLLRLVTFLTLVSPPAILYALPVERFTSLRTAQDVNVLLLSIVAAWRVALLAFYLVRSAELRPFRAAIGTMLPITLIVVALTALNLERAVFDIMSGMDRTRGTPADGAYEVLFTLSLLSFVAFLPLFVCYVAAIAAARAERPAVSIVDLSPP